MKWIGQHIWDFISRFRSDVYLEDLTESAQDHVVGVDADGKLYKQDVSVGDITGVTAGDALTGGGTSGAVTINHEDTSSQASVDNSGSTFIQDVTLDTYGHITGLTSAAVPTLNQDTTGQAGTVATIAGLAPNTATTQATQPNITTMTGFVTGSANQLITDDGDGTVTSEAGLTWDGDDLTILSANTNRPKVFIKNTANHAKPPHLEFIKDKGAAGVNGDSPGLIAFMSDNAAQAQKSFASISVTAAEVTANSESGIIDIGVISSNGVSTATKNAFQATGANSAFQVDTTIGFGASSTTTLAGDLDIDGDAITSAGNLTVTPGGTLELDSTGDMTLDSSAGITLDADNGRFFFQDDGDSVMNVDANGLTLFGAGAASTITFEGTTDDDHQTVLSAGEPTADRTITMPNATGTVALTNTHISIIRASFFSSSTSGYYITLGGGSTGESSSLASSSYTTVFNCPFDGKVKRIAASTQSGGSKTVKLEMYIDKDDSDLVADQRGSDWNVSSYTNAWCEDSPGDWTFSKGENIAIRATDSAAVYGTQYSIVLEFDLTT